MLGRSVVVGRVVVHGETLAQAAAGAGVSKSTVWTWVQRWKTATQRSATPWSAWPSVPVARGSRRRRCPQERPRGSASCARRRAGAPGAC
ncbi:MAG: hypothetical protein LC749_18640 [Actinobacteria bacterium]|nr:hypothetical protein [Actinomycetota bacterium]